jgi:hypothetical protein
LDWTAQLDVRPQVSERSFQFVICFSIHASLGSVNQKKFLPLFLFLLIGVSEAAKAETLGKFRFSEIFLSPRLRFQEPGGFELQQSELSMEWERDHQFRGVFALGTGDYLQPPIWYTQQKKDFAVTQAWVEVLSFYGDFRAGLLPVPLGFEGAYPLWNSILPESAVRAANWMQRRDLGVQFHFFAAPWRTQITVHNGEVGENKDGALWVSGLWEYKNSEGVGVLLTASTGRTKSASTSASLANSVGLFNFNPAESAKHRLAVLSIFREDRRNLFLLELGRGELVQENQKSPWSWSRADLSWNFYNDVNVLFRYEGTQADLLNSATATRTGGLGFVFSSKDNLQSLTLYGAHHQEIPEINNDEYWMIFRLNSSLLR